MDGGFFGGSENEQCSRDCSHEKSSQRLGAGKISRNSQEVPARSGNFQPKTFEEVVAMTQAATNPK